jgi:zinc protease
MLEILGRVVAQPKFLEAEWDELKKQRLHELETAPSNSTLADEAFYAALYGAHPYGHNIIGAKESLAHINRADISDFYDRFFIANNAALVIAGETSLDHVLPILRKAMGGWRKGQLVPYTFTPPKIKEGINIRLLDRADQINAELRVGNFAVRRTDADYLAAQLLIDILSQRLSRDGLKLQAALAARKLPGPFLISANLPTPQIADAINNTIGEFKKISAGVEAAELQAAKTRFIQEQLGNLNTNTELAARWADIENYNLGALYLKNLTGLVEHISVDDLHRASHFLSPDNLTIFVSGRAGELEENLKRMGKLEIIAPPGNHVNSDNGSK